MSRPMPLECQAGLRSIDIGRIQCSPGFRTLTQLQGVLKRQANKSALLRHLNYDCQLIVEKVGYVA